MSKQYCTLTDERLIAKVNEWVSKLARSGGKEWVLRVPVDFNNDPDMLIVELGNRFIKAKSKSESVSPVISSKEELGGQRHLYTASYIESLLNSKGIDNEGFVWTDELVLKFYKFANNADRNFTGFYSDLAVFKAKYSPKPADQVYEESIDKLYEKSLKSPTKEPYSKDEWQIISFEKDGKLLTIDEKGWKYRNDSNSISDVDWLIKFYPIHSVLRKSDNTTWVIGEEVNTPHLKGASIKSFGIFSERLIVDFHHDYNEENSCPLSDLSKPLPVEEKKVLFVTEDGVEIMDGDKYWNVSTEFKINCFDADKDWTGRVGTRTFSTEEKAKEYITLNKPCLSVQDLLAAFNIEPDERNNIIELAKNKQQ